MPPPDFEEILSRVRRICDDLESDAYRRGWCDAMTALRKAALETTYDCPQSDEIKRLMKLPRLDLTGRGKKTSS